MEPVPDERPNQTYTAPSTSEGAALISEAR
jgi:hypothetical protein